MKKCKESNRIVKMKWEANNLTVKKRSKGAKSNGRNIKVGPTFQRDKARESQSPPHNESDAKAYNLYYLKNSVRFI